MSSFDRDRRRGAGLSAALLACAVCPAVRRAPPRRRAQLARPRRPLETGPQTRPTRPWPWTPPATRSRSGSGRASPPRAINLQIGDPRPGRRLHARRSTSPLELDTEPQCGDDARRRSGRRPGSTSKTRRASTRSRWRPGPRAALLGPPVTVYTARSNVIPQELQLAIGDGGDRRGHLEPDRPRTPGSTNSSAVSQTDNEPFNCPNPSSSKPRCGRPAAASRPPQRISEPRGTRRRAARLRKKKKNGEIAESSRGRQRSAAPRSTGPATRPWSGPTSTAPISVVQTAVRAAGGSFTPPLQVSESGADAGSRRSASTRPATRSRSGCRNRRHGSRWSRPRPGRPAAASPRPATSRRRAERAEAPSIDVAPERRRRPSLWRV